MRSFIQISNLKAFILIVLISLLGEFSSAQDWPKIFGNNFNAYVIDIYEDYDYGYIIGGSVLSNPNTFKYAWIIKTDIDGNELWNRKFGNGVDQYYLNSCAKTGEGSSIICGGTSVEDPSTDPIFFKLNSCGELEWCRIFLSSNFNVATDVIVVNDGYVGMLKYYGEGSEYARISLLKMDSSGEPQWIQRLAQEDSLIYNEEGGYLYLTKDLNYLIAGECFYPGLKPFWIKVDTTGNQIWDLMWQGGVGAAYQLTESDNNLFYCAGGFAGAGYAMTPSIFKFDNIGNPLYQNYLLGDTLVGGGADPIIFLNDSTLITGIQWRVSVNVDDGYSEVLMTDTLGNIHNRRILLHENKPPKAIILTHDSKIIITGNYVVDNNWDIYLWKMNQDLEDDSIYSQPITYDSLCPYQITSDTVDLECSLFVNIDEIPTKEEYETTIRISPNPANEWITIVFPENLADGMVELSVYDLYGKAVLSQEVYPENRMVSLNISNLSSGFYVCIAYDYQNQVMKGKFVVGR